MNLTRHLILGAWLINVVLLEVRVSTLLRIMELRNPLPITGIKITQNALYFLSNIFVKVILV